jgi:hypothetical protein
MRRYATGYLGRGLLRRSLVGHPGFVRSLSGDGKARLMRALLSNCGSLPTCWFQEGEEMGRQDARYIEGGLSLVRSFRSHGGAVWVSSTRGVVGRCAVGCARFRTFSGPWFFWCHFFSARGDTAVSIRLESGVKFLTPSVFGGPFSRFLEFSWQWSLCEKRSLLHFACRLFVQW